MKADGPPGASSNGFNENLALFNDGKCGMWIDATVAAGIRDRSEAVEGRRQGRLRARARQRPRQARQLAVGVVARRFRPARSKADAAQKFISWATSKHYTELVASKDGWASVPPGTRTSLYKNPDYLKAAPFAQLTLDSIDSADPLHPTVKPVPYTGVQFVAIPEFQGIGDGRRPGLLGGARRHDERRRRARQGAGQHGSGDEEGRLHQVSLDASTASRRVRSTHGGASRDAPPRPRPSPFAGRGREE